MRSLKKSELLQLHFVGPATVQDLALLDIFTIEQLAEQNAEELYVALCEVTSKKHNICMQDVFACAIAQAQDPNLPAEEKHWMFYTKLRKQSG